LNGIVFSLSNPNTNYSVQETTANGGVACWTGVPLGTYVLREVSTISGYVLDTGSRQVSVVAYDNLNSCDSPTNTISWYNYRNTGGAFKIAKKKDNGYSGYSGTSSDYLSGATFLVEHVGGSWTTTVTTDSTGVACVTIDSFGTFRITETNAPSGYTVNTSPQTITISQASTCANTPYIVYFYDTPVSTTPPTTTPCTTTPPTTRPPTTTPPTTTPPTTTQPTTTSSVGTCALQIAVYGKRAYTGGQNEPLSGATLGVTDGNGRAVAGTPFVMSTNTQCVNVPLGTYSIQQYSPPPSGTWTPTTSFPISGSCTTSSTCPQTGVTQTITYTAP
jgi:uncharacterized surface anchored protein